MRRLAALLAIVAVVAAACERGAEEARPTAAPSLVPPREVVEEAPAGDPPEVPPQRLVAGEAADVMAGLCVPPDLSAGGSRPEPGAVDARIVEVEDQVAATRGLEWLRPVIAEPISDDEMDRRIDAAFADQFPADLYDRRTLAWRTIGVIGPNDDLHDALLAFGRGQVVGYYDPQDGELVYRADGGGELSFTEKAVLAHELVHALDDQHFDLRRVDGLLAGCRDEEIAAALGVVEGSAQHFSTLVLLENPAPLDLGILEALGQGALTDVPPFVAQLQLLSYTEGQGFVGAIADRGLDAVNEALSELPPTTEHILHPERWPDDEPTSVEPVDVSDGLLGSSEGWTDLDVMQIGELWLRELLELRLDGEVAGDAAAGWDGGAYRAWRRGSDDAVIVTMRTAWDSPRDAEAFADAMTRWIAAGETQGEVSGAPGSTVDVTFVSGDVSVAGVTEG